MLSFPSIFKLIKFVLQNFNRLVVLARYSTENIDQNLATQLTRGKKTRHAIDKLIPLDKPRP